MSDLFAKPGTVGWLMNELQKYPLEQQVCDENGRTLVAVKEVTRRGFWDEKVIEIFSHDPALKVSTVGIVTERLKEG